MTFALAYETISSKRKTKRNFFLFQVVNKFALPAVLVVLTCILCTFIGAFMKFHGSDNLKYEFYTSKF